MLPLQQTLEVKESILEYIKTTHFLRDEKVRQAFYEFINNPRDGIFKGPYISLKLPFQQHENQEEIPLKIKPNFKPYLHQLKSFKQLRNNDDQIPKPTIISTGTGSGKTECFLYPILDYCHQKIENPGIKVIILYPMNALATDQAKRFAEVIYNNPKLKGKLTAGLFIGVGKNPEKYSTKMRPTNIIENRDEILKNPPDILLTNYKMLDYGLLRNQYKNLWQYNQQNPKLLKFLVLDEIHSYDGAQGTDVANLIRRLKLKLRIPKGHLCPIGTSATIGNGKESINHLTRYASDIFGEIFTIESVIFEKRIEAKTFFDNSKNEIENFIPEISQLDRHTIRKCNSYPTYIKNQKILWNIPTDTTQVELSEYLKSIQIVQDIVSACSMGIIEVERLVKSVTEKNKSFADLSNPNNDIKNQMTVFESILSLMTEAKLDHKSSPFLYLQVHLWIRELSGMLRIFDSNPKFVWREENVTEKKAIALPPYYCRQCGASGWLLQKREGRSKFEKNSLTDTYKAFFNEDKTLFFVNVADERNKCIDEYIPTKEIKEFVNRSNLTFNENKTGLQILGYQKLNNNRSKNICPECNEIGVIGVISSRLSMFHSIASNQVLSSDLDYKELNERKILSFANSVQDAAYLSGHVRARTFRFIFRASLQSVITKLNKPMDILSLTKEFINYWKQNSDPFCKENELAYFYRFFPSDYIGKADIEDFRLGDSNTYSQEFKNEFDLRIKWEVFAEFGINATIGRTLEKTNCAVAGFELKHLRRVYEKFKLWLMDNNLWDIEQDNFVKFLYGLLHRIRIQGGINHPYLKKFREGTKHDLRDLNWKDDNQHFLNKIFHTSQSLPKILCTTKKKTGILKTTFTNTRNWYYVYFLKNFPNTTKYRDIINDFFHNLFIELSEQDILDRKGDFKICNYALNPDKIIISKKVSKYQCDKCTSSFRVYDPSNYFDGVKCIHYRCNGSYSQLTDNESEENYYKMVYNRSKLSRIYSSEHTGLLEREMRYRIESDFKDRPNFNSKNVLVATPTLEMGIDIGNLSSVFNTSVPPLASNFLQRIGRAGRKEGSALILNFCQNKEHDLFFFEEPLDMMEGEINTPGCYLNAKDILRRHFNAYCIDSWTTMEPNKANIPKLIGYLNLKNNVGYIRKIEFVDDLCYYVKKHQKILLKNFKSIYEGSSIEPNRFEELKYYLKNNFRENFMRVFEDVAEEMFYIQKSIKKHKTEIHEGQLSPTDRERNQLESNIYGLKRFQKEIEKQQTLELLTNQGILPNYGFPESGTTLKAYVFADTPKGGKTKPSRKFIEIVRPSNHAIYEFAPTNHFYNQGYKLNITGLNVYDWNKSDSNLVEFRFCSVCDALAENIKTTDQGCPKCGDLSWNTIHNTRKMVRIKSVHSINNRRKSSIRDDKNHREIKRFLISHHFRFNMETSHGSYVNKRRSFGMEFIEDTEITKVNLGLRDDRGQTIHINGIETSVQGFHTCKNCGKSTPELINQNGSSNLHYSYCKERKSIEKRNGKSHENVFIYRTLKTEALKILIPLDLITKEQRLMFKSGIELGLKKFFRGQTSHLNSELYSEYSHGSKNFEYYLVLYDSVPGGTGYLRRIFNKKEFHQILKETYIAIKNCICKKMGKDGCYRCILSFSNQFERSGLSRDKVEECFKQLLEDLDKWEKIDTSLVSLNNPKVVEESELELLFRDSLYEFARKNAKMGYNIENVDRNNVRAIELTIPTDNYQIRYEVIPQGTLEDYRLSHTTRPDYLFRFVDVINNSIALNPVEKSVFKDVALYIDGYEFHASKEHNRFIEDIAKREMICKHKDIHQWTLTYRDIQLFKQEKSDEVFPDRGTYGHSIQKMDKIRERFGNSTQIKTSICKPKNSIERLLWFLTRNNCTKKDVGYLFACLQEIPGNRYIDPSNLISAHDHGMELNSILSRETKHEGCYFVSDRTVKKELFSLRILSRFMDFELSSSYELFHSEEIDREEWMEFYQIFNLIMWPK